MGWKGNAVASPWKISSVRQIGVWVGVPWLEGGIGCSQGQRMDPQGKREVWLGHLPAPSQPRNNPASTCPKSLNAIRDQRALQLPGPFQGHSGHKKAPRAAPGCVPAMWRSRELTFSSPKPKGSQKMGLESPFPGEKQAVIPPGRREKMDFARSPWSEMQMSALKAAVAPGTAMIYGKLHQHSLFMWKAREGL